MLVPEVSDKDYGSSGARGGFNEILIVLRLRARTRIGKGGRLRWLERFSSRPSASEDIWSVPHAPN